MVKIIKNNVGGEVRVDLRNRNEHVQRWWQAGRFYEPKMLDYIRKNYSGGTFVDAGASIGNHTLYFAAFCDCRVLSIEPHPLSFERLTHNLGLNDLQGRVITEQVALSAEPGTCSMINVSPATNFNIGMFQVFPGDDIQVVTLDSLIEKHGIDDVTLLKMDVEWYELFAIAGAADLLSEQRPVIFIETPNAIHYKRVAAALSGFGYKQHRKFNVTPTHEFVWAG